MDAASATIDLDLLNHFTVVVYPFLHDIHPHNRDTRVDGLTVEHAVAAVKLDWVDVVLYPTGVGFLFFKVSLAGEHPKLANLIEINSILRLVHPLSLGWKLPVLRFEKAGQDLRVRDLM